MSTAGIGSAVVLFLQLTGVLGSSRDLPKLEQEAKILGIPTSAEERLRRLPQSKVNVAERVTTCFNAIQSSANLKYSYSPPTIRANSTFKWDPKLKKAWMENREAIYELEALPGGAYLVDEASLADGFSRSSLKLNQFNVLRAIAISLANEGKFDEGLKLFVLDAKLLNWNGERDWLGYSQGLINQSIVIEELITLYRHNPERTELRKAIVSHCEIALRPHDYRWHTWNYLGMTVFSSATGQDTFRLSQLSNDIGRGLSWLKMPIVFRANQADILKAYIEGYKVLISDPTSVDKWDSSNVETWKWLERGNSLTKSVRINFSPRYSSSVIRHELKFLRDTLAKYK